MTGVAAAVATDPVPPIARYRPDVSPSLAAVIEKCLAKRPEDRYQTIAELAEALVPFGPPEAVLSLQRISGVLGLKRQTANTDLRDSARNGLIASGEQLTQIAGQVPTLRRTRPARTRWLIGLALVGVLGSAIAFLAKRTPVTIQVGGAADSSLRPSTETLHKAAEAAPVAQQGPTQQDTAADPSKSAPSVTSVEVRLAPQALSGPTNATATHKPMLQGQVPRVGAAKSPATKGIEKSTEGGSFEDIVDTRH
ncbi:MAG: hypothetical protein QM784_34660 [Polyangiaceae bacterium]